LLIKWFGEEPAVLSDYLKGVEKSVKTTEGSRILRGEIDALFGNAVIEFESDLNPKAKLREAKEQLQGYVYALIKQEKDAKTSFLCIASDGILFYVYTPWWKNADSLPDSPEEIELKEIEHVNFAKINSEAAYLWLDRYFFRKTKMHPTTEEFVRDFGINSPAYNFSVKLLQAEWQKVCDEEEFKVIYENWEIYLSIAYGTKVADQTLFLRHTYLACFAKLLAYMRLSNKTVIPTASEIQSIYTGTFFQKIGIINFLDDDFFTWVVREKVQKALVELAQRISTLLEKYHLEELSEDVLKSLYQELVDPETRHDLGEFYTPDWLADRIVRHALKDNPRASVLDPMCGSASFLYFAIRYKRERLGDSKETLDHIRDSVVGIDIHPLAVIIAKTNYLLGLGELLRKRLKDFQIPVYMANSLKIPERQGQQISAWEKVPCISVELDHTFEPFPEVFIEHPAAFDQAVDACHEYAKEHNKTQLSNLHFRQYARRHIEANVDDVTLDVLFGVAKRMRDLMDKGRDSIWAFILKNVYKPIFLKNQFDWILGNPPWLSFRYVEKGDYQDYLRNAILNAYGLLEKGQGHLITQLELGTLVFCASLYQYGKKGSRIGFVLPRSIFTADQHHNFRATTFGKTIHQTGITEVWDLEKVSPLFNVPSCVVFGTRPHFTQKPIQTEVLSGELSKEKRNVSLDEAKKHITKRDTGLYVVRQGERSFWSEDQKAEYTGSSPYASSFSQGATIVPRTCWFVQVQADSELGFNPSAPFVKTDQRAIDQAKEAYADLFVEGNIEKEFLYATLLSTDLLPFGFLDYRTVVLPIVPSKTHNADTFIMLTADDATKEGYIQLARWLKYCEKEWNSRRKEKAKNESLLNWLDYRHKLTDQHYKSKYKVVYPTSATTLCGAVITNEKIAIKIGGQKVILQNFVAESKLYYYETENENEAHFLSSFLNSPIIDEKIKPMQSRGLWGPRDIHKKVWELPIPTYKEEKREHRELAQFGIDCAEKVKKLLPELETKDITPGKIGRLRNEVRERLKEELAEIDGIVKKVMGK
jgi:hypothetical protein